MRCPQCNKWMPAIVRFCPKCGKKLPENMRMLGKFQVWIAILSMVFLFASLGFLLYVVLNQSMPESTKYIFYVITGILLILFAFLTLVLLFFQIVDFVKFLMHHPIFASIFCGILVVGGGLTFYFVSSYYTENYYNKSLSLLHDSLIQLEAMKITGDEVVAEDNVNKDAMKKVEILSESVTDKVEKMEVPKELKTYKEAIIDRGEKITTAAQDTNTWGNLGAQGNNIQLDLSDQEAYQVLELSIDKIAELKEFGDTAIMRGDTETMKYIAAKLYAYSYLLDQVSKNKGPEKSCIDSGTKNAWCADEAVKATNEIAASAADFAGGGDGAKESWNNSWNNIQNELGGGITIGGPVKEGENSPIVQAFYDECSAKRGIIGGAGAVKTGLPTTEFGYTCEYKFKSLMQGELKCWDFLSYSAGRYKGGNNGCPTENLYPTVTPETQPTEATKGGTNWDGTYSVSTTVSCSTDIPGMPTTIPVDTTVIVTNNVGNDEGSTFLIDENGEGTEITQYSTQGENYSVNTYGIINYQFHMEGGAAKFNAIANLNGSALVNNQMYTFSCYGTASSTRQ